ncbi:MAG: N-glycosylase/DNA lyase [Acidobacteriota bacterium]
MKKENQPLTIEKIKTAYSERGTEIRARIKEFEAIWETGTDELLWEEMVFCFFTGGCSAKMGIRSIEAVRPILLNGNHAELADALRGNHRYPNARAGYIVASRKFLQEHCEMRLRRKLQSFNNHLERRDWLVKEKRIKGLGYKEASHFLRNIGFKGYAILDKHVLRSLAELKIIDDAKPPSTRLKYLTIENQLKKLADSAEIDFDELDLVLWSLKTGEILK